ncbi:hypothetical protein ACFFQW_44280 [Umezawaea endophytica]|uniref:SecDF P1 head subdomain domain-containing protein n=1 Tax=Umezawaea endophytica TaxID=1654476 RepID=A0A9X3ADT1_9PSEU|nr:hypothetical protein [Umezawaea endophytica]MCS7476462.1 hypothetical protein [Umezawaea endophytica]
MTRSLPRAAASVVLAAALTACTTQLGGHQSPDPSAQVDPAGQLSATGAPKLRFRPVLATTAQNRPTGRQQVEPTKATTPERLREIADEKKTRQGADLSNRDDPAYQVVLQAYECPATDPLTGEDDPALPLITCNQDNTEKYVLGPVFLDNTQVSSSVASVDQQGAGSVITLKFTDQGTKVWADFTTANVQEQVALVFNTTTISAPTINEPILGGTTQISGAFTLPEAKRLADQIAGR